MLHFVIYYILIGFVLAGFLNKQEMNNRNLLKEELTFKTNLSYILFFLFVWPYFYFMAFIMVVFNAYELRDEVIQAFKGGWSMNPFAKKQNFNVY